MLLARDKTGPTVRFVEALCERASRASHANGASRRSGERESVSGSPRGEAPRMRRDVIKNVIQRGGVATVAGADAGESEL